MSRLGQNDFIAVQKEKKIKFGVRCGGSEQLPEIQVFLSKNAYKSRFEDRMRTRARRYNVAIRVHGKDGTGWSNNPILQRIGMRWVRADIRVFVA